MVTKPCVVCGKDFVAARAHYKSCGFVCRKIMQGRWLNAYAKPNHRHLRKTCEVCGGIFSRPHKRYKVCSAKCAVEKKGRLLRIKAGELRAMVALSGVSLAAADLLKRLSAAMATRACVVCAVQFQPRYSSHKTCGQACRGKWRRFQEAAYRNANPELFRESDARRMCQKQAGKVLVAAQIISEVVNASNQTGGPGQ